MCMHTESISYGLDPQVEESDEVGEERMAVVAVVFLHKLVQNGDCEVPGGDEGEMRGSENVRLSDEEYLAYPSTMSGVGGGVMAREKDGSGGEHGDWWHFKGVGGIEGAHDQVAI
ncbi:hypothetical protein L2E82_11325 [Cichorium intybus]|uniref:Uncharacterized protein n=1 Tax=Cichorium intybus TaxID=13427 RepID=A0ACB9GE16_CICIN|nr:hypothetical protein L2E82_11325 [Cichorium intybus]